MVALVLKGSIALNLLKIVIISKRSKVSRKVGSIGSSQNVPNNL